MPIARLQPSEVFGVDTHCNYPKTAETAACATKPICGEGKKIEKRAIRVGFLSAHFRWHSVGRLTVGLLERLGNSRGLEVFVIDAAIGGRNSTAGRPPSPTHIHDTSGGHRGGGNLDLDGGNPILERLDAAGVAVVRLSAAVVATTAAAAVSEDGGDPTAGTTTTTAATEIPNPCSGDGTSGNHTLLQKARETVAALKLDVLVYGDVGMDALTTGLAHSRLSPVQVAFWGHPGTTGLSTMDYFITSDLFEGEIRGGAGWVPASEQVQSWCGSIRSSSSGSSSATEKFVDGRDDTEGNPDTTGAAAHDAGTTIKEGPENTEIGGGAKKNNRQNAFSEQLVRLSGLGVVFDDPTRTFRWDPACGDSGDLPGNDKLPRDSSHRGGGETGKKGGEVVGERQQQHHKEGSSNGSWEPPPPPPPRPRPPPPAFHVGGGGVVDPGTDTTSPDAAMRKATAAVAGHHHHRHLQRPRLYVCIQSIMKMHPAFDAVLAGILAADPLAQVLLLRDSRQLLWHSRFRRRLREEVDAAERRAAARYVTAAGTAAATVARKAAGKYTNATTTRGVVDHPPPPPPSSSPSSSSPLLVPPPPPRSGEFWTRVRFVGPLSGREFFRLQCRANVVLDPFPFGGGVTTLEASGTSIRCWCFFA